MQSAVVAPRLLVLAAADECAVGMACVVCAVTLMAAPVLWSPSVVSCARRGAPNEGLDEGVDERGDPPSSPPPPPRDLASQAPGGAGRMDDGV